MKGKSFIRKKRRPKRRKIKKNTYTHLLKGLHLYPFRHIHILILASFFMLVSSIVLLPTVIVSLPKEEKEEAYDEAEAQTVDVSEEQVTVPVMRTESEAIDDVPLEQYVTRVVASEMPADFELEALKAQALAARTYVINHLLATEKEEPAPIKDSVSDQVYHDESELRQLFGTDYHWKMEKIEKAVQATESEILTYEKQPITPAFFSTSNGYTENSEDYWESALPYLRSVKSDWDEASPKFLSQHIFTIDELESLLDIELDMKAALQVEISRTDSNRVKILRIADTEFSGRQIREQLELPSNDFTIEQGENHIIFTTKGYGHGVGMSQYGANGMAKEGKSYTDIVSYYYKEVDITHMNDLMAKRISQK